MTNTRNIMLIPIGMGTGLTSISLGLIHAIEQQGIGISFLKPIVKLEVNDGAPHQTSAILKANTNVPVGVSIDIAEAETLIGSGQEDTLLEQIIKNHHDNVQDSDVVLIEGILLSRKQEFAHTFNFQIAKALDAQIIFVMLLNEDGVEGIQHRLEIATAAIGGIKNPHILGVIFNKLNAPMDKTGQIRPDLIDMFNDSGNAEYSLTTLSQKDLQPFCPVPIIAAVSWSPDLTAGRASDLARQLNAQIINAGEYDHRRIHSIIFCARSIPTMLHLIKPGALLVTSADRPEILITISLSEMNGVKIGAVLLTGGYPLDKNVEELCKQAFSSGLPVFLVPTNTWQTSINLQHINLQVLPSDKERVEKIKHYVAQQIDGTWVQKLMGDTPKTRRLSPAAFRFQLSELARKAHKQIVLPEGQEPRTIKAAIICAERGIANTILLGNPNEITRIAASQGLSIPSGVRLIDPEQVRPKYVERLIELRKNKGMTEIVAREQLKDNVMLGTMMLERNEVDGLVSGAIGTTANTMRPPLQIIKTAPGNSIVSSIFFMLLPEQVLIYGDCAINPDPTAEQLAEIAIQSADSAIAFGIEPRVAMISYSTGSSGTGSDVEKVRTATQLAKEKRPDLMIDGPLQYDAAVMMDVARSKAPDSPVAGRATVFIFPDLNTGNTTYKAVQRSANLISIGPMLQGMRKPVNDLSRGALVDDIVYTIALTAIQATQG